MLHRMSISYPSRHKLPAIILVSWAVSAATGMAAPAVCLAQDAQANPSTTSPADAAPQPLKGGVVKTAKTALSGLKSLGVGIHQLKRAVAELYAEATRTDVQLIDEPDMIGMTVISIPVGFDSGTPLPARKRWVDLYMAHLSQLVPLVQEEVDGLLIPDDKQAQATPLVTDMESAIKDIESHYATLQSLAKAPPYDSQGIAAECKSIDSDIKKIEEAQKKVFHIVKEKPKVS